MRSAASTGKKASDLSGVQRWFIIILVSMGSSAIYGPAYLKNTFYDAQMDSLHISNTQVGALLSAYAVTATICYLPSGLIADRIRMRTLAAGGFILTALLTFWYALLPSYGVLIWIFVLMGVTSILVWWGVRYKLVRLVSTEATYSRNIGISYGFYGVMGLLSGLVGTWILGAFATNEQRAFRIFLIYLGAIILALGILSLFVIPKFDGEIGTGTTAKEILRDTARSLTNPVVLITAVTVFFVYLFYTCTSYTAPYMTQLGAGANITNLVSVFRTFGVTLLAGPVFGALAGKAKKPSLVIWTGSALAAIAFAVLAIMPMSTAIIVPVAILALALGFISNGVFSIVSAQLTEGKVPTYMFGAATGVVSLVGFLPDTFSGPWFGSMLDNQGNAGFKGIFLWLAVFAILAALSAIALSVYVKHFRKNSADDIDVVASNV